jgi:hypothetical protein
MTTLLYGFITGILFGFLLQRGQVLRYDKQLGALRLMDMTIVKFMLSSILVAMVGFYLLYDLGLAKLSVKATIWEARSSAGSSSGWAGACSASAPAPPWARWAKAAGGRSGALSA